MLFPNLTVADNIGAGVGREVPKAERERIISEELERFGLRGFGQRYPAQLSGGQQQRVALARMLAARLGILMLDGRFSALDSHLKGVLEQNLVSLFPMLSRNDLICEPRHRRVAAVLRPNRRGGCRTHRGDGSGAGAGGSAAVDGGAEAVGLQATLRRLEYAARSARPPWGIDVHTAQEVPRDVKCLGLRAFYVERAEGPGENCYRVRVDRVSDARFERMALLGFLDRDNADGARCRLRDERDELPAPAHVLAREHAHR